MSTKELADELWVCLESSIISDSDTRDLIMDAATMLRQQQAEIEALKNKLEQYEILEIMIADTLQKAQEK